MKRFILSLSLFFLITSSHAQEGLQKVRIDDFRGGMVSNSIPEIIAPNQGASLVNVIIDKPGKISKRRGVGLFCIDGGDIPFRGIGRYDPDANTSYLIGASRASVVRATASASIWTAVNYPGFVAASPQTTGLDTSFVQANKLLFVLNGFDNTAWHTGPGWIRASNHPTSPPIARTGAWLRNYLFLAGQPNNRDWIYFSNNLEPTIFTATDIIKINTGDGQVIQKIVPFRLNELIIYKERSIFVLDITGSTPLTDWTVQPISKVLGTIAPKSIVSLGNDQWFLSSEPIAIRSLVRSEFDKILLNIISGPIQDIFDGSGSLAINRNQMDKAAGIFFDNKYMLAIPTGTSLVNNTVVVYDFISQGWYLINGWFPAEWTVFNNNLYYTDATDGKIVQAFRDLTGDFQEGPNGILSPTSAPSVAVRYTYISRAIDFDNRENFKQLDAIEVEFNPTGDYNAEVFINLDNSGWQKVGTINLESNLDLAVSLPARLDRSGIARETFQLQRYGEFKIMQVMIQQGGYSQECELKRISIFGRIKPWRRE